jgi:RNA-directed DNA polymerase
MPGTPRLEFVFTKQQRIAELARNCPDMSFTNLAHHIDMEWMLTAHGHTRRDGAVGVDGQTADEYEVNLEANLQNLLDRAKSGTYVAPPVRRVHIPKAGSATETRPLGIPICHSYCTSFQRRWGLIEGGLAQDWALFF